MDQDKLRKIIAKARWTWAKTYKTLPHEWIFKGKCGLTDKEFEFLTHEQWQCEERPFGNRSYRYLFLDGYKYWSMDETEEKTDLINRARLFDSYDTLENPEQDFYSERDAMIVANALSQISTENILEIGCGTGKCTKYVGADPKTYLACEPSRKLSSIFKENTGLKSILTPFEAAYDKWSNGGKYVIATFGSASYIMKPYLEILRDSTNDYFLMFFKSVPDAFSSLSSFNWDSKSLADTFPNAFHYSSKEYYIVSSKKLDFQLALKQIETRNVIQGNLFE